MLSELKTSQVVWDAVDQLHRELASPYRQIKSSCDGSDQVTVTQTALWTVLKGLDRIRRMEKQ
jgi:hypothetical protein